MPKSGKGKKRKKKEKVYDYKYPILDFEKLKQVPKISFEIKNVSIKGNNTITGELPIDYSFNKIKEMIQEKHKYSCHNLRLYVLEGTDSKSNKKYLDDLICKTFKELGITAEKFVVYYEFAPFDHPTLEASLSAPINILKDTAGDK